MPFDGNQKKQRLEIAAKIVHSVGHATHAVRWNLHEYTIFDKRSNMPFLRNLSNQVNRINRLSRSMASLINVILDVKCQNIFGTDSV